MTASTVHVEGAQETTEGAPPMYSTNAASNKVVPAGDGKQIGRCASLSRKQKIALTATSVIVVVGVVLAVVLTLPKSSDDSSSSSTNWNPPTSISLIPAESDS